MQQQFHLAAPVQQIIKPQKAFTLFRPAAAHGQQAAKIAPALAVMRQHGDGVTVFQNDPRGSASSVMVPACTCHRVFAVPACP